MENQPIRYMKTNTRHSLVTSLVKASAAVVLCLFYSLSLNCKTLQVDVSAGRQALPDYEPSSTFVKVDLRGIRPEYFERAALNLSLVIDQSGSMSGQKI